MGLRDRYLTALVARCVVAVPRECDTQHPPELLHVAPPREMQHATDDANPATTGATSLQQVSCLRGVEPQPHATGGATATQQPGPWHATAAQRSSLDEQDAQRRARITWLGYDDAANRMIEMLLRRDRDIDSRHLCVECHHAGPGWHCAKREAFLLDQLQRCPAFTKDTRT